MATRAGVGLKEIARLLRPYAGEERPALIRGVLLALAVVALQVLRPWPIKWILDHLGGAPVADFVAPLFAGSATTGIVLLSLAFVALSLGAAAAEYAQIMTLNGAGNRILFRFRAALFQHILRQPLEFHESRDVGELLTRIVYDTSRLRRGVNGMLIRIVQPVALFVATIVVLLWIDSALAGIMAIAGLVALIMMRRRGRRIASASRKQRRKEGRLATLVANELLAIRELQTFGGGTSGTADRFEGRNSKSLRQEQKVRRLAAGLTLRVDVALAIAVAAAMALGADAVLAGDITPGDLVLFFSYALALRAPFTDFSYQTARLGRSYACAERLARIVDRKPTTDHAGAAPAPSLRGAVTFETVSVKSPARTRTGRKWALNAVSFDVKPGERVAIVGANGSGKSTLLRAALRLVEADRGRVLLDGADIRDCTADSIRAQMSVVFQDSVLSGLTVRENITLGLPDSSDAAVEAAVARAGAAKLVARLRRGYDTPVRRGGRLFSGGERQRLALARAILRDGRIWLLDEPTSGLDTRGVIELADGLFAATEGRTVLWVTHDPAVLSRMDRVIELRSGRLVSDSAAGGVAAVVAASGAGA
ncbi:MAG: ABC transporter ATP-binding protein/permease [Gemmatimonadaceae bacterium]|nr:ABC transporter ATP-binding protein/permease [Gemmatimonadaceae bacterium]